MVASRDDKKAALFLNPHPGSLLKIKTTWTHSLQSSRPQGCHQHIPPKRKKFLK